MGHCRIDTLVRLPAEQRGVFVDTGAYLGQSMANALEDGFGKVVGIELSRLNFAATRDRFNGDPRVDLYLGSSHVMLEPALLPYLDQHVVVWQDAHYQGVDRANEYSSECGECPVLAEIAIINKLAPRMQHSPVLLIDDAQVFYPQFWEHDPLAAGFTRAHWPSYEQIAQALGGRYRVRLNIDPDGSQVLVCTG